MQRVLSDLATKAMHALLLAASLGAVAHSAAVDPPPKQRVTLDSDGLTLVAFLYVPAGTGPWPALLWNHGSEPNPEAGKQFDTVASHFVPAGYVVFTPQRRGHGGSAGEYIVDRTRRLFQQHGRNAANRLTVQLLKTEQLDDQLAALAYLKQLPYVNRQQIVVAGCSFGGIQALLGAANSRDYRAAVSISPGALVWKRNSLLRSELTSAIERIDIPVLVIQPANDATLAPSRRFRATAKRFGKPLETKVYPATGSEEADSHCFGGASGIALWAQDATDFIATALGGIKH